MGSEIFQKIMLLHPRNRYGTYSEHCRTLPTASNIKKRDSIIVIHRSWNQYKAQEQCVPYFPKKRLFWYVFKRIKIQNRYFNKKSISLLLLQSSKLWKFLKRKKCITNSLNTNYRVWKSFAILNKDGLKWHTALWNGWMNSNN